MVGKRSVELRNTKSIKAIVDILVKEAMVGDVEFSESSIIVKLKYRKGGNSILSNIKRVSKPGQRIYSGYSELNPVMNGRGVGIISTSEGFMTYAEAKSRSLGGELICEIW